MWSTNVHCGLWYIWCTVLVLGSRLNVFSNSTRYIAEAIFRHASPLLLAWVHGNCMELRVSRMRWMWLFFTTTTTKNNKNVWIPDSVAGGGYRTLQDVTRIIDRGDYWINRSKRPWRRFILTAFNVCFWGDSKNHARWPFEVYNWFFAQTKKNALRFH